MQQGAISSFTYNLSCSTGPQPIPNPAGSTSSPRCIPIGSFSPYLVRAFLVSVVILFPVRLTVLLAGRTGGGIYLGLGKRPKTRSWRGRGGGALNAPPAILLGALSMVGARHE